MTDMLTEDERALMVATICLHGFDLYERFPASGVWRPLLAGGRDRQGLVEVMEQWEAGAGFETRRVWVPRGLNWQPHHWFKLSDRQVESFHHTVLATR